MALQVWLPLNKDFRNIGLLEIQGSPITTATTIVNGGKFNCLQAGVASQTTNGIIFGTNLVKELGRKFSASIWVRPNGTHVNYNGTFISSGNWNTPNGRWAFGVSQDNTKVDVFGPSYNTYINCSVPVGQWTHLVSTFDNGIGKVYKNGEFAGQYDFTTTVFSSDTTSFCVGRETYASGYFSFNGNIADLRIYDNVLCEDDVNELYNEKRHHFLPIWEHKNELYADASYNGHSINQIPHNVIQSGASVYFNGSSSYIQFNSLKLSGGTLSLWINVDAKPNVQRVVYFDPRSKMVLGFLSDGNLCASVGTNMPRYSTTGISWGNWNHVAVKYGTNGLPSGLWVNGVMPSTTGNNTYWSTGATEVGTIGRRINYGTGAYDNFYKGYIKDLRVYNGQLSVDEIRNIYSAGSISMQTDELPIDIFPGMEMFEYSGCTWLKVLHHNNPSVNLFTQANCKDNNSPDLYSKLYLFDDANLFKMSNGKYEFMVRERLESNSAERQGLWVQSSSPTAATVSGYQLLSSGGTNPGRAFGLVHQTQRTHFDNKASWWCACGSYTPYQGGIPGFWQIVKTGYIDLFIRVDGTNFLPN